MRLGVMGGTFDPIHNGHLFAAEEAGALFDLDQVLLVPAARPPHKRRTDFSPAADRLRMAEIAAEGNPRLVVSRMEIDRDGPSYTVETLRELRRIHGADTEFFFIVGTDEFLELGTWKDPAGILELASFIVATRPGYPTEELRAVLDIEGAADSFSERVLPMDMPGMDISSTDIRERAAAGRPFRYLVPEAVWTYVNEKGLYGKR